MDNNNIEDVRKKRDSREVGETGIAKADEKSKKQRGLKLKSVVSSTTGSTSTSVDDASVKQHQTDIDVKDKSDVAGDSDPPESQNKSSTEEKDESYRIKGPIDIESAVQLVVKISDGVKEFISDDAWITFRVGHAGDASLLADLMRKSKTINTLKNDNNVNADTKKVPGVPNEDTPLEVRLADGLGDEDTPPSVFSIMIYINKPANEPQLAGASLFFTRTDQQVKVLQVEFLYVDDQVGELAGIIERRLWLRLCTLAVMLSCEKTILKKPAKNS